MLLSDLTEENIDDLVNDVINKEGAPVLYLVNHGKKSYRRDVNQLDEIMEGCFSSENE